MRTNVDGLEKERDFYFGKLRDIEVLCQEGDNAGTPLSESVLQILYATEVLFLLAFYSCYLFVTVMKLLFILSDILVMSIIFTDIFRTDLNLLNKVKRKDMSKENLKNFKYLHRLCIDKDFRKLK